MKRLTSILFLTIAMVLGSTAVSWGAEHKKLGDVIDINAKIYGQKIDGNRFCAQVSLKNNQVRFKRLGEIVDYMRLTLWGHKLINRKGEEAELLLESKDIIQPELDPNAQVFEGQSAEGWLCWKMPTKNWSPRRIVIENSRFGKKWAEFNVTR